MTQPFYRLFSVAALVGAATVFAAPCAFAEAPPAAAPTPADAALREQVRGLVKQAGERLDAGDKRGAIAVLEQARRLRPDPSIDYNIGITYSELGDGPEAARAFERFLRSADPTRILPERIDDVKKRLAEYERTLCRLRAHVTLPPGSREASLFVDNQPSGIALSGGALAEPLWLLPGAHRVRISAPGLRDYQVAIDLAGGDSREVTGELYRDEAYVGLLAAAPPVDHSKEPQPIYKKWWFWTAIGVGTATAVGLIAAGASGAFTHTAPGSDLDPVDLVK